jgi:hypothetical protein
MCQLSKKAGRDFPTSVILRSSDSSHFRNAIFNAAKNASKGGWKGKHINLKQARLSGLLRSAERLRRIQRQGRSKIFQAQRLGSLESAGKNALLRLRRSQSC